MTSSDHTIAIIGAGMAGLSCAQALSAAGHSVTLFDKGRGPGGRMATRRADVNGETVRFDHGAQHFKGLDTTFAAQCEEWQRAGVVKNWAEAGEDALVGAPSMNAILRHMAEPFDVHWAARIERIERAHDAAKWLIHCDDQALEFDSVISAIPAEQAAQLFDSAAPNIAAKASRVRSAPCWAAMAAFDQPLDLPDCVIGGQGAPIAWAARNSAKPGRGGVEAWVIHGSAAFSQEILELPKEAAGEQLLAALFAQTGIDPVKPVHLAAHRWLYAFPAIGEGQEADANPADAEGFIWDAQLRIGACGDWLNAPNIEGAWLSGQSLAAAVLDGE